MSGGVNALANLPLKTDSNGYLLVTQNGGTSKPTEIQIANGVLPEYFDVVWASNVAQIGNVTNGGTARNVRILAPGGSLIIQGGSDKIVFDTTNGKFSTLNATTLAGMGTPIIVAQARATAQTAAVASVATFTPTADATVRVTMNVLVTTSTTHSFTCQCTYTDEGNTARTITAIPFRLVGDTTAITTSIAASATVPYMGIPLVLRVKSGTAVTLLTQAAGTYTTVTFNVEGIIEQLA